MMKRYSLLLGLGGLAMALGGAWLIGSNPVSEVNAKAGDPLTTMVGAGSYGTRTTKTYDNVKWVLSTGQSGYLGTNKADNHKLVKPTVDDLPVVKAVNSSATTSTTGYYYYYTTTALANVGSVEFSYTAANNYTNAKAKLYIVAGDAVSAANGANYQQIDLAADSTRTQGYQISSNDGDTHVFTFAQTQSDSRYYGLVIELSAYQRYTNGTITLREGVSNTVSMSNFEAIAGESSYTTYDVLEEDNFLVDGTRSDGAAISSDDYTVSIGSTDADGVYTKRTDVIWGTTLPTLEDNTIRFTSLYPSEVGGSEYPYADVTITVSEPVIEGLAISGSMSKLTYNVGDAWDPSGLVVTGNPAGVDVTDDVTWSYSPAEPIVGTTSVSVTATYGELTQTTTVEGITVSALFTDTLTSDDLFTPNSSGYTAFSNVKKNSDAVYAGTAMKSTEPQSAGAIQLNSPTTSSPDRGIYTSTSGGTLKSITVKWNTGTASGRSFDLYGSTKNCTNVAGYKESGTLVETFSYSSSSSTQTYELNAGYKYIAIVAKNTLYLDSVSFTWEASTATVDTVELSGDLVKDVYYSNETAWDSSNLTIDVLYSDAHLDTLTEGFDLAFDPATPSAVTEFGIVTVRITATYDGVTSNTLEVLVTVNEYIAPTYDYTFTEESPTGNLDNDLDGVKWSYFTEGNGVLSDFDSTQGVHFGTNDKPYDLICFYSEGFAIGNATLINRVDVEASCTSKNNGNAIIQLYVNGALVGQNSLEPTSTTYTFNLATPTAGHIEIRLENISDLKTEKAALYLKGMKVYANEDADMASAISLLNGIEGFNTCDLDTAAYSTWKAANEATIASLGDKVNNLMVFDYTYDSSATDQTADYGTSARGTYLTFADKYNALNAVVESSGSALNVMANNQTMIVAITTIIGTAFILGGAILVLRRRYLAR